MTNLDAAHRPEEGRVGGHDVNESSRTAEKFPWTDGDRDYETDACSTADADLFGEES